jgi:hypothetical protein
MLKITNWFLANGDKYLAAGTAVVGVLSAAGVIHAATATAVLGALTFIHNTFLPEPKAAS